VTDLPDRIAALPEYLGRHPARALGLDLGAPEDVARWFVAACLLAGRGGEAQALEAFRELERCGAARIDRLSEADAARICAALERAGYRQPEAVAGRLVRAAASLAEAHGGSLEALAAEADGLEALGARLARLASGLGTATILRFLRPLRGRWPSARDVPLTAPARAAAVHLGLLREGEDLEGEPGALRAALRTPGDPADLADLEAALERLGARACLRNRPERCPLAERCPARSEGPPAAP
jgi:endonuclease III